MVKRSKSRNKARKLSSLSKNPVISFSNAINTLATATATKIRHFIASIVTRAGQCLKTSPAAGDNPVAGKSLWTFLHRIVSPRLRIQVASNDSPTPTPAEPATSLTVPHPAPVPVAQPSASPRIETPARLRYSSDVPAFWTDRDNTDIKIDSNGKYLSKLHVPPLISQRIDRYKRLSKLFDTWLIAYTRYYPTWGRQSSRAPNQIHIAIEAYEGLAEEVAHRVNEDVSVRKHVQEIVDLRGFVNSWYQDVIRRKHLPATCGIAEEARNHIPPYEAMVTVLEVFGGCIDRKATSSPWKSE
ncbi:hypothetical protein LTR49_021756 [Elasticomyces elasticus]|nr:hypothetical protein LTR49_021756 [Elasticomyces elasticus]